jgi:hypothetical protein
MSEDGQANASNPNPKLGLICETCGYPIHDKQPDDRCPECGEPVAASNPHLRVGLPWQRSYSLQHWVKTFALIATRPRQAFRKLNFDREGPASRLFLLTHACSIGLCWGLAAGLMGLADLLWAWGQGMLAAKAVLLLTYVEAAGVTVFSQRRGWRVPCAHAERVVCYAAVGWWPAAVALFFLLHQGVFTELRQISSRLGISGLAAVQPVLAALGLGLMFLVFELLVWTGVRQIKYANRSSDSERVPRD